MLFKISLAVKSCPNIKKCAAQMQKMGMHYISDTYTGKYI